MRHLIVIFVLFPFVVFSQSKTSVVKKKGEIFKQLPTKPYEDLSKSGVVVVKNGMYGLVFSDTELSQEVKDKVAAFFLQRNNGYTELKVYTLKVEKRDDIWYIEGYKVA